MVFCTGKVGVIVAVANPARSVSIVHFEDGECGLYVQGLCNQFGTSLAARGTREELLEFVADHRGQS